MSDYTVKGRCLWHPKFIAHRPYAVPERSLEKTHRKGNFVKAQEDFVLKRK